MHKFITLMIYVFEKGKDLTAVFKSVVNYHRDRDSLLALFRLLNFITYQKTFRKTKPLRKYMTNPDAPPGP